MLDGLFSHSGMNYLTQNDYDYLRKALSTGYNIGGTTQTGGGAMRMESLDNTLAILTEQNHQLSMLNDITRQPATSTAIEYAQRTALAAENGGFYDEGELPEERDDTYARKAAFSKYVGTVKNVTLPAQLTRHVVDQVQEATAAGTMWVSRLMERKLFGGDALLGLAGAQFVEFDGLERYIERDAHATTGVHEINLWGRALEEQDLRDAGQVVARYHGIATHAYLPTPVLEDYALGYLPHFQHRPADQAGGALSVGFALKKLQTVIGDYTLRPVWLYHGITREEIPSTISARAPSPACTIAGAVQATGTGEWENSLGIDTAAKSGSVTYRVCLGNKYGQAAAVTSAAVAISYANRVNSVRLTITNPAGGYVSAPTYAAIYRTDTNADGVISGYYCVGRIALTSVTAGGAGLVWDDDGDNMPGTYRCWVGMMDPNVFSLRELLPFTRIPLPQIALSTRFALVTFCTTTMRDPFKWVQIKNIARRVA